MTAQQLPPGLNTSMQPMTMTDGKTISHAPPTLLPVQSTTTKPTSHSTTSMTFTTQPSPPMSTPVSTPPQIVCPTDMPSSDHQYENESDLHRALRENYQLKMQINTLIKENGRVKKENKVSNVQISQSQRRIKQLKNTLKKYSEGMMPTKLKEKIGMNFEKKIVKVYLHCTTSNLLV